MLGKSVVLGGGRVFMCRRVGFVVVCWLAVVRYGGQVEWQSVYLSVSVLRTMWSTSILAAVFLTIE